MPSAVRSLSVIHVPSGWSIWMAMVPTNVPEIPIRKDRPDIDADAPVAVTEPVIGVLIQLPPFL